MAEGLVSTIIPVFNRPEMLVDAVQSVLRQTYRPIEVIVVDDGSTDNTSLVADQLADIHPEISTLHIANGGPGVAREAGRLRAKGDFIQYLDSDDVLKPDKFEQQVSDLQRNSQAGISYCICEFSDMKGNVIDKTWMRTGEKYEMMFPAMLSGRLWGTPVPLYRKQVLDSAGPWTNLKIEEDWEYDCRIAKQHIALSYISLTLVTVRSHSGQHLGRIDATDINKHKDRLDAFKLILQHSLDSNVSPGSPELLSFSKRAFLVARQGAQVGLVDKPQTLLLLLVKDIAPSRFRAKVRVYIWLSRLFGWKRCADTYQSVYQRLQK